MQDTAFRILFFSNPAYLSLQDQCIKVSLKKSEDSVDNAQKLPLSDILAIVIESHAITLSSALLSKIAIHNIALFTCGDTHLPNGVFMGFLGHYRNALNAQNQINLSQQSKVILWQKIIKQKLLNQANLLSFKGLKKQSETILSLSKSVKLNDATNNEAKAAQIYFKALFGNSFVRFRQGEASIKSVKIPLKQQQEFTKNIAINAALNYVYAILRGMIARTLSAYGLLPNLGIFHHNLYNSFNLADDLIEPYRVFAEFLVLEIADNFSKSGKLDVQDKAQLVNVINLLVAHCNKRYPLHRMVVMSVQSLLGVINGEGKTLILPTFNKGVKNGEIYASACDV